MILLRQLCVLILMFSFVYAKLNDGESELTESLTKNTILSSTLIPNPNEDMEGNHLSRKKRDPCGGGGCGCGGGGGKVIVIAQVSKKRSGGFRRSHGKGYGKFKG
ncbi:uncharacterized protein LOC108743815 [Agrilus planipennis]|uniref:Uncharacterized protein LOC108743815 n=1 Tax=Agrilus planipennis TaxID=224129 RepID=A0A1W4XQ70_AGRPL|nr:uncharacterized protein LOC108743815 [Agrilus planipennis]